MYATEARERYMPACPDVVWRGVVMKAGIPPDLTTTMQFTICCYVHFTYNPVQLQLIDCMMTPSQDGPMSKCKRADNKLQIPIDTSIDTSIDTFPSITCIDNLHQ